MYTLFVCMGMFLNICGSVREFPMENKKECEEALQKWDKQNIGKGYIICYPADRKVR